MTGSIVLSTIREEVGPASTGFVIHHPSTHWEGQAAAAEVAIGDFSVQLEVDSSGGLKVDILNVARELSEPVLAEQYHTDDSLVLLVVNAAVI